MGGRGASSGGGGSAQSLLKKHSTSAKELSKLPSLTGSEKQKSWASNIRHSTFSAFDDEVRNTLVSGTEILSGKTHYHPVTPKVKTRLTAINIVKKGVKNYFKSATSASDIIDARGILDHSSVKKLVDVAVSAKEKTGKFPDSAQITSSYKKYAENQKKWK